MSKVKITVTVDKSVIDELDRLSEERQKSRSRLIEEAIRTWQRWQREQKLIQGYRAMAKEDVRIAEANLAAGQEIPK